MRFWKRLNQPMMAVPHNSGLAEYLRPTEFIDSDSSEVAQHAHAMALHASSDVDKAVRLYHAVRDGIRYDPYRVDFSVEGMRASTTLRRGAGFCVPKAILLAAMARSLRIPSRLGFADVKNHLATKRLLRLMRTDLFVFHGYTELFLAGRWVKATPAFNSSLCARFNVQPLAFDGRGDAIFQQHDRQGNRFIQYVHDRGQYSDLPLDAMRKAFEDHYPHLMASSTYDIPGTFDDDVVTD